MRRARMTRARTRTAQPPIASQCTSSPHEHDQHKCALDGPNNERRCIHIEESGKVTLQVDAWRFKVSSRELRRTSRVWDELLQPRQCFYSEITIRLPEDLDPWALEIILRIQHQKTASLPAQLTFERLRHLAIVCDRYHVAHLITQLAVFQKWVQALEPHANESERVDWLHIAYTFGLEDIFERLAKSLVLTTMLNRHGNFLTAGGRILHPGQVGLPPGIIESIANIRHQAVQSLCQIIEHWRVCLRSPGACRVREDEDRYQCNAIMLGSLEQALPSHGPTGLTSISVQSLANRLRAVNIFTLPTKLCFEVSHEACNVGQEIRRAAEEVFQRIPSPVQDAHREYMRLAREMELGFNIEHSGQTDSGYRR